MSKDTKPTDSDGKFVLKLQSDQIHVDESGLVIINDKTLSDFVNNRSIDEEAHLILMGRGCGCQCCC